MLGLVPETIAPEKWRRLWRRRLRRRPLLPFMLAAFLAVDAAFCAVVFSEWQGDAGYFLLGLVFGQVPLIGAWVASRRFGIALRMVWGVLLTAIIASPFVLASPDEVGLYIAFFSAYLALVTVVAGVLELRRSARQQGLKRRSRFQFTIGLLVGAMTAAPLTIIAVTNGEWWALYDFDVVMAFVAEAIVMTLILSLNSYLRSTSNFIAVVAVLALGLLVFDFVSSGKTEDFLPPGYLLGYVFAVAVGLLAVRWQRRQDDSVPAVKSVRPESIDLTA
jgi:hypothetical protein